MTDTALRTSTLGDLVAMLEQDQARKVDAVVPASKLTAVETDEGILFEIADMGVELNDDGVTTVDGLYRPTDVAIEHVAEKLSIPLQYLRRIGAERPDLFGANVNGWLHGNGEDIGPDGRSFLVRMFRGSDDDRPGIMRAMLSDKFKTIDNLDVLVSALEAIASTGVEIQVQACDLTERRMYVRIHAPSVAVMAPQLLAGYRSPFTGNEGADNPVVFAGFCLANSEVGGGSWTLAPQIVVQVCTNGMTMTKDVFKQVHLGGKLDEGIVQWTDDTRQKQLDLIKAKARDTVATFLNVEYVQAKVTELEAKAGIEVADAEATVKLVAQRLNYSDAQRADVLRMFIKGGQTTAGGIMQAVTAAAQLQPSGDTQWEMEADALPALDLAASAASILR